ncbi:MAG: hypothetical protein COW24_04095 [Candidatus Kerfeldbacteria bacterium CG15_BIG_FIL_POST_REV_8_21_14_020_45_12]|uniref:Uncharacterized protein n=1 Tax=Candidatus Kerfeldbacteria bacterium CG15_BIG_FIL_POST_REV_8_21_14_020_45_12 TaxID=2014247 RepID=A0A2M7H3A8_9BACT|nr:MAG: hypothetical protein COW24_04095 [Candidatus Kerfeldbacteria bacterium CG15_BIG_FIL_POST_REV_8_21_14_020_45_12]PJA93868.1 MAG: hypothetical protein CO132_01240 [Candidatus Kerfeldbacteria bacterium CG_4_9_14_3_um_filter_45_8]
MEFKPTKSKYTKAFVLTLASLSAILIPAKALAHHIINSSLQSSITSNTGLASTSPTNVATQIVSAFLGVLGIIALVLIIYAGFRWMTAGGNEEKVADARKTLQAAVIGLLIILASYGISLYVFVIIEGATGQGAIN